MLAHPNDPRAERILTTIALPLVEDVRQNLAAAHRVVQHIDRCDLEALAVILAALVPDEQPVSWLLAWLRAGDDPVAARVRAATPPGRLIRTPVAVTMPTVKLRTAS